MTTTRGTEGLSVTTTEHPNATRMREGFAAFGRGELDTVRQDLATDAVWVNGGRSPLAGTYRGWDEISQMFGRLFELTGGTWTHALVSVLADDQHAVAIYDATATVNGVTAEHRFVLVQDMAQDGTVQTARTLAYDQEEADALLIG
ncbi:MAG: hypothetical protein JWN08_1713 [Frankiales bacterium]|nr:hypothetical protein [Frankiales bacterium]